MNALDQIAADEWLWQCEPEILRGRRRQIVAVTPRSHPYRLGVVGNTEDDAVRRFKNELLAWRELHRRRLLEEEVDRGVLYQNTGDKQ